MSSDPTRETIKYPGGTPQTDHGQPGAPESPIPRAGNSSGLVLGPGWQESVEHARQQTEHKITRVPLYQSRWQFDSSKPNLLVTPEQIREFVAGAAARPVAFAGLACASRSGSVPVYLKDDEVWIDPRSVEPQLLAVVLAEPVDTAEVVLSTFVIDVRNKDTVRSLAQLLERPIPFAMPNASEVLYALWQLELPAPSKIWDCALAERAFTLGRFHPRYAQPQGSDVRDQVQACEYSERQLLEHNSLSNTCVRHRVTLPLSVREDRLRELLRTQREAVPFPREIVDAFADRARAAAQLFPLQSQAAITHNCLDHLTQVEMPWAIVCPRMTWDGVRVDHKQCQNILLACDRHEERFASELASHGLTNPFCREQLRRAFEHLEIIQLFPLVNGQYSFEDKHLKAIEHLSLEVRRIRAWRKVRRITEDKMLTGALVGKDGRLRPEYRPLGADTGRTTMRTPNVGGIGRALRPLVVPEDGYGIGEVDLCQIEVLIAAAVYGDIDLVRMANNGDVYCAMARRYFANELPAEALTLSDRGFKKQYRYYRDRMKQVTLAIMYGISPFGLARRLNTSEQQAAEVINRFLQLFPALARGLEKASGGGAVRGYAEMRSGLRRYRGQDGPANQWEINWLRNTPVQGSAAVAFKVAGIRLFRRYQHFDARIILPMHDALVFEAPKNCVSEVAKITAEVLTGTVQEYFPVLNPKAEINIDHPCCWNKDGKARSLALWMIDPELAGEYLNS